MKSWFETFKILHKIFIENPDDENFEPNDPDYVSVFRFTDCYRH